MDPSCDPQPPPPIPLAELRRPLRPMPAPANEIRAVRSTVSSNAPRVFSAAVRRTENVFETLRLSRLIPQFLCFLKPLSATPEDAIRRAALPATASPAIAAPAGPRLRDPLYSKQKCPQSPSARPSCFECHHPSPAQASRARNPPAARCQFHPVRHQRSRSIRVFSPPRQAAARLPQSRAQVRQEIRASPSSV